MLGFEKGKVIFIIVGVWLIMTAIVGMADTSSDGVYSSEQSSVYDNMTSNPNIGLSNDWWSWASGLVKAITADYSFFQEGSQLAFVRPFFILMNAGFLIALAYTIRSTILGG